MYSLKNSIKKLYTPENGAVGKGMKYLGLAGAGLALMGFTGCAGMQTVPSSQVPQTKSASYEQLQTNPAFEESKNKLNASVDPQDFEKALQSFYADKGYDLNLDKLDSQDGKVNETTPTEADLVAGNPSGLLLPENVSVSADRAPLEEIISGTDIEKLKNQEKNGTGYVGGGMSFSGDNNSYIAVPEGKGYLLNVLNNSHKEHIEDMLGDFQASNVSTYRLKQGGKTAAVLEIYQNEGKDNIVVPTIDLFRNGYDVDGVSISPDKIKNDEIASHYLNDNAKERFAIDAATGGAVAFLNPVVGGGVFMANLVDSAGFDNVIELVGQKSFHPPRKSDESFVSYLAGNPSGDVSITYPVFEGDEIAGVMRYSLMPTQGNMVVRDAGLSIEEKDKYLAAFVKKLVKAGVAAGIYEIGKSDGDDKIVEKVKDDGGSTGGGGRTGGDGVTTR